MSRKAVIRAAILLAVLLGLWALLGGAVPFIKVSGPSSLVDAEFRPLDPDDVRDGGGMIDAGGTDRSDQREFTGDEYDPDKERRIDEMIEDAKEREEEEWGSDE